MIQLKDGMLTDGFNNIDLDEVVGLESLTESSFVVESADGTFNGKGELKTYSTEFSGSIEEALAIVNGGE